MNCPKDGRPCPDRAACGFPCLARKDLDRLGVPGDMAAADVLALFSLPDDDDTMHSRRSQSR